MIPALLWPHITIEEINSLTDEEAGMLLYIVNVWAPIRPPIPTENRPYPISLTLVRAVHRNAVIDRIIQACTVIKDEGKEIYNNLRTKLGIPNPPPAPVEPPAPVVEPPLPPAPVESPAEPNISEINKEPLTGSNVL